MEFQKPEAGRRTFTIKRIINHPDYLTFQGNDVALVELTEPVTYSDDIQPLCLSRPGDVFTRGSLCYTSGWGKMDPDCECWWGLVCVCVGGGCWGVRVYVCVCVCSCVCVCVFV